MEKIDFSSVNLAELLPRIPDTVRNGLPFGIVKLDLEGNILEYNMAEGELTGVDPAWAMGRNFFDEVAICTKTQAFYGRFLEGVKRGFMNVVFDFTFSQRAAAAANVKVHMFTLPDSRGKKTVMLLVKRSDKPLVVEAFSAAPLKNERAPRVFQTTRADFQATRPGNDWPAEKPAQQTSPEIQSVVNAVMMAMNQSSNSVPTLGARQQLMAENVVAPPVAQLTPQSAASARLSRHQDILKF